MRRLARAWLVPGSRYSVHATPLGESLQRAKPLVRLPDVLPLEQLRCEGIAFGANCLDLAAHLGDVGEATLDVEHGRQSGGLDRRRQRELMLVRK